MKAAVVFCMSSFVIAAATSSQISDAANGQSNDYYYLLGGFIPVHDGPHALTAEVSDGLFMFGTHDTGFYMKHCELKEMRFCFYNEEQDFYLMLPKRPLSMDDHWSFAGHEFRVTTAYGDKAAIVDITSEHTQGGLNRMVVSNGSIIALLFGRHDVPPPVHDYMRPKDLPDEYVSSATVFVWSGDEPFVPALLKALAKAEKPARK